MTLNKNILMLTTILSATMLLPVSSALAQDEQNNSIHEQRIETHIEGHIAFLKAELNITPDQEAPWNTVAAVMRADATDFDRLRSQYLAMIQTPPTALRHLEERAAYTALQATCEQRFLDAFRPLYQKLSDAQKKTADELLGRAREES